MDDYNSISVDSGDLVVNDRRLSVDDEGLTDVIRSIFEIMLTQVVISLFVLTVLISLPNFTQFLTRIGGVVIIGHFFLCFFAYYVLKGENDKWNSLLVSLLTCTLDLCFAAFGKDLMLEVRKENIALGFVLVALVIYILKIESTGQEEDEEEAPISYYDAKVISAATTLFASFAIHFYYYDPEEHFLYVVADMIRTCFLSLIYVFNLLYFTIDNPYTIQKYYPDRIVEGLVIIQFDVFTAIFLSILSIFSLPFLALIYLFDFFLSLFK